MRKLGSLVFPFIASSSSSLIPTSCVILSLPLLLLLCVFGDHRYTRVVSPDPASDSFISSVLLFSSSLLLFLFSFHVFAHHYFSLVFLRENKNVSPRNGCWENIKKHLLYCFYRFRVCLVWSLNQTHGGYRELYKFMLFYPLVRTERDFHQEERGSCQRKRKRVQMREKKALAIRFETCVVSLLKNDMRWSECFSRGLVIFSLFHPFLFSLSLVCLESLSWGPKKNGWRCCWWVLFHRQKRVHESRLKTFNDLFLDKRFTLEL